MKHHGARGVCAVLMRDDGRILLHLRCESAWIYPNYWAFIGGGVERGESSFEALRREWREELGYSFLPTHRLFDVAWHRKGGRRILDHTYIVGWEPWQRLRLLEGKAIEWFTVEKALRLENLPPHERGVLERLT